MYLSEKFYNFLEVEVFKPHAKPLKKLLIAKVVALAHPICKIYKILFILKIKELIKK